MYPCVACENKNNPPRRGGTLQVRLEWTRDDSHPGGPLNMSRSLYLDVCGREKCCSPNAVEKAICALLPDELLPEAMKRCWWKPAETQAT